MYHAHHPDDPSRVACGERPTPNQILIWADDIHLVTCCDCIRALGWLPSDIHPDRYQRQHSWAGL